MADRIRQYMYYIDDLLQLEDESIDWDQEIKNHLIQISFFSHERLIHLLVMITFALLTFMVFLYTIYHFSFMMFLLIIALMILLIPYIKHYFLLENSVQDMYEQYDKMQAKVRKSFIRKGKYRS